MIIRGVFDIFTPLFLFEKMDKIEKQLIKDLELDFQELIKNLEKTKANIINDLEIMKLIYNAFMNKN